MKFIHTADWHLGRQFHNVSLLDDQRAVLEQFIAYVEANPVDAIVIAGDIYDRSVPPTKAIALLDEVLEALCERLKTPVIMIPGNHDGAQRLGFAAKRMKNSGLYIISDYDSMQEPVVLTDSQGQSVAFYGLPYSDPEQASEFLQQPIKDHDQAHQALVARLLANADPEMKKVLIAHCFVDGAIESDSERPLSIGGADQVSHEHFLPFDYTALGHLHQPQKKGTDTIRYSGSLMKYSFSEQHHNKGFTLVDIQADGVEWTHCPLNAPHNMRILEGEMAQLLSQGQQDPYREDYLLVRLLDKHAILNPMDKLREVYPNVLHLEKPGMNIGEEQALNFDGLARNELDMFRDFYREVQQSELTEPQQAALKTLIQQMTDDV